MCPSSASSSRASGPCSPSRRRRSISSATRSALRSGGSSGMTDRPRWRIDLLGTLRATEGVRSVERFRTQKVGALLGRLAIEPGRAFARDELVELLWPAHDPEDGRNNL